MDSKFQNIQLSFPYYNHNTLFLWMKLSLFIEMCFSLESKGIIWSPKDWRQQLKIWVEIPAIHSFNKCILSTDSVSGMLSDPGIQYRPSNSPEGAGEES
jgi:hypothetical protein